MTCTLGVDLGSRPARTAACALRWHAGRGRVVFLGRRTGPDGAALDPAALARLALEPPRGWGGPVTKVGIDAPLGWPRRFVEAVSRHRAGERWTASPSSDPELVLRVTDRWLAAERGGRPLSVSASWIAYCAFRAAELLARLPDDLVDRSGESGLVAEVYPAAALREWWSAADRGLPSSGYKGPGPESAAARARIVEALLARAPWLDGFLDLDGDAGRAALAAACVEDHDRLDALVAALVARAVERGDALAVEAPRELAREEGWIRLPAATSLERLAEPAVRRPPTRPAGAGSRARRGTSS